MDSTLTRAKRTNKHRQERNFRAWQRFSPDGTTCRFCKHDHTTHLCTSAQPHFYRPATEAERSDPTVTLYRHTSTDNGSVLVWRMTVAKQAEIVTAFCTACAEAAARARCSATSEVSPPERWWVSSQITGSLPEGGGQ